MLKKFSGSILYILISLLVISLYLDRHETLEKIEMSIQDTMLKFRGKKDVTQDIVIVGIDDLSLRSEGKWPWNRDKIARLIDAVSAQKPQTIALDLNFTVDDYQKAAGFDDSLSRAIARAGNVVMGFTYSQADATPGAILPSTFINSSYRRFDDASSFSKYPPTSALKFYTPPVSLADSAKRFGFVNVAIDRDRNIRWQPLVVGFRGEFYPSIQVAAAAHYMGVDPSQLGIAVGSGITIAGHTIPTDSRGQMNINYNGPSGTFKSYSASDIMNKQTSPVELAGKLVVIGYNGYGAPNVYPTPVSKNLSALELDANVIENIINNSALKGGAGKINFNLLILIAIGVFTALILPKISLINRMAVLGVFFILIFNVNYILFTSYNLIAKTLYPALQIIFFLIAAPVIKYAEESKEKQEREEDEEVDYESLLSSSQSLPTTSWIDQPQKQAQAPQYASANATGFTGRSAVSNSSADTLYASQDTAPVRTAEKTFVSFNDAQQVTDHFGRYKIIRPIGKGAMGMVYHGLDPAIDRPVALKTIRIDQGADEMETMELKERLIREAKAAGKISHPNIVTIYDVGEEGSMQYIAMEYLEGNTLENILKSGADWDYRTISRVMIQACEALDYAHENGIVHRDIKPANIMILEGNKVKVMDFGIARLDKSASMTQTGTALGTPNYISPEQLRGQPVDRRSDIFSLGVVFYEVLTHEKPFKGDTISALIYSILHTDPPRPSEINLDIPRIFDKIIGKGLVKDPDLRFQRARDISDILRKLI
jgi:eukaryotic-like serine/threonine-protein kinase